MKEFILVRDALTDKLMIIRTSMICSVEEAVKDNNSVRRIYYTDNRTCEYVKDSLISIWENIEKE